MQLPFENNTVTKLPPMLTQYLEYKKQFPECLLFFQVGDFFELFFEDAITVSQCINLTLTSRDKNSPEPVPMCGVPISAAEQYVERLVNEGFSVALVRQFGEVGPKGVLRKLDKIVTPGLRVLGAAEASDSEGIVAAVQFSSERELSLAISDIQSGEIRVREGVSPEQLREIILTLRVSELILPRELEGKALDRRSPWVRAVEKALTSRRIKFRSDSAALLSGLQSQVLEARSYLSLSPNAKRAVLFLISYVIESSAGAEVNFQKVVEGEDPEIMVLDSMTRENLELVQNLKDSSQRGTLFEYLNRSISSGGRRLLRNWILNPLLDSSKIDKRQNAVEFYLQDKEARQQTRRALSFVSDIERIVCRLEIGVVTPRELSSLYEALMQVQPISALMSTQLVEGFFTLPDSSELELCLKHLATLQERAPLALNEGGIFKEGVSKELDHIVAISTKSNQILDEIEKRERVRTGIQSLKIKSNSVFGYFIEVTTANLSKVPSDYARKQTTTNGERFITEELKKLEQEIESASSKRCALERELFDKLKKDLLVFVDLMRCASKILSTVDVIASLAEVALEQGLTRPRISGGLQLKLEGSRHPQLAARIGAQCIPNDINLDGPAARCIVLTGPNMGGKSTYLRQVALTVLMAQIGSFVPASSAELGVVDRIFARLGAADDLHEGESTFMVEMREAASITHNATERSLVLIDEIGRGTATKDGLSLAQAILEWLISKKRCRTLFATHFHELTDLECLSASIANFSVGSVEEEGNVTFTHKIQPGPAKRSYGLEVAKLAGLPEALISRAYELFSEANEVSRGSKVKRGQKVDTQMPLFVEKVRSSESSDTRVLSELKLAVEKFEIEKSTPLEALGFIEKLQRQIKSS